MVRSPALPLLLALACSSPGQNEVDEGNRLAAAGRFDDAASSYRAACAKTRSARPRELLGMSLHAAGKLDEARAAWLEAAQLQPDAADAQLGLSRIDLERGDLSAALDRLDRILERQPKNHRARTERAIVLLKRHGQGDAEHAYADSQLALASAPHDPDALYTHASACLASKKLAEATAAFGRLKPLRPALAAWGLARVAAAESRNTDVIVHLREARDAADAGWVASEVREDPAFRYLWDDPEFSREF
ncbi:MAG: tetratricopeptide repeat protein [Archangiaceae bacterium]|nr:tetratricopeptide repeat protein [Archangiaceae bacterium]